MIELLLKKPKKKKLSPKHNVSSSKPAKNKGKEKEAEHILIDNIEGEENAENEPHESSSRE